MLELDKEDCSRVGAPERYGDHCSGIAQLRGEIGLNFKYKCKCVAKELRGGQKAKLLKGNIRVSGDCGQTNLTGFLLRTGQGDQISPGGWGWRCGGVEGEESVQI